MDNATAVARNVTIVSKSFATECKKMPIRLLRVSFVLLLILAVTPLAANAGPCFVKMSDVKQNAEAPIRILGYYATITSNALDIAFINTAQKPATTVLWEVRAGDGHGYVRDKGNFAPNVEVHHCAMGYGLHQGNFVWQDQARVRVVRVLYADGSQWSLPDAPPDESDF